MRKQDKKVILENIVSLLLLQGVNYVLPLIILPYLVQTLGAEKYGLNAFALSFVQYFVIIIDYGFNLSATRSISVVRDDRKKVSEIFVSILIIKLALLAICLVVMAMIIAHVPKFRNEWPLYSLTAFALLGNVLFPIWLYQGLEKMKLIAIFHFCAKIIMTLALLYFVRSNNDYYIAAFIQSLGVVVAGVLSMIILPFVYPLIFVLPCQATIVRALKDGWNIFISQFSVALFSNTGIFFLGFFATDQIVGFYAIADKIAKAVIVLAVPVCNSIYPRVNYLFSQSRVQAEAFLHSVITKGSLIFGVICVLLFITTDIIVRIITGQSNQTISLLVRIMSLLPFTVFVDNIYGTQVLLSIGHDKYFMRTIIYSGIFSLTMSALLVPRWGAIASATVFALTGIFTMVMMIIPARNAGIRLLNQYI